MKLSTITKILGEKNISINIKNEMDLIELGQKGLPKKALSRLIDMMEIPQRAMSAILNITERTIQNYSPNDVFNSTVSEQILQIAEVYAKGLEVFDSKEDFLLWLKFPNKAMSNKIPLDLLKSRFGATLILDELGRIEHGIIS